jgi:hypothetical protein
MNEKLIHLLQLAREQTLEARQKTHDPNTHRYLTNYIDRVQGTINDLEKCNLATLPEAAHSDNMKSERENDHLIHALHDVRVELVRTNEGLRSLSIVLSKLDLGNTEKIEMKVSELAGGLAEVKTSALKGFSEVRNRIDAADARIVILEKQLTDADIPAEAEAALADLKTIVKQLDDIVPDAPDLPPVVNPPAPA